MQANLPIRMRYVLILYLLLASVTATLAQGVAVKGKVTSETGEGLPGVTVLVKGTSNGTATDAEGDFSLSVPGGTGTLVVYFIGYQKQEVSIKNSNTVNIKMAPDANAPVKAAADHIRATFEVFKETGRF